MRYRMWDTLKNTVTVFHSFEEVIAYCARYNRWYSWWGSDINIPSNPHLLSYEEANRLLREFLAFSPREAYYTVPGLESSGVRNLIFFDPLGRVMDMRDFWYEIANFSYPSLKSQPDWALRRKGKHPRITVIFRQTPVPHTGRWKKGAVCKNPQTFQERKLSLDEEHAPYIRPSRKARALPSYRPAGGRNYYRSWKHQSKRKHQWDRPRRRETS